MESVPGLYLILLPDFTIAAVSDAYLNATMTRRHEILGKGLFEVFPDNPDDTSANGEANLRASLNLVLESGKPHYMAIQKYDIRRPDGTFEVRYWSPKNLPVLDAQSRVANIIHCVEDVTEFLLLREVQKKQQLETADLRERIAEREHKILKHAKEINELNLQLQEEVAQGKKLKDQLQILNKELEAFSYSVSHDLRSPLRSIDGYARILEEDYANKLDDDGKKVIKTITRNAKRMGRLIDDMLNFSRQSRIKLKLSFMDMNELVSKALRELLVQENGRNIQTNISNLTPANGDADMIYQVWVNLISNAIKYTGKKPVVHIEIGSQATHDEVRYFVKDNGDGFNKEYAHKLFGVFQRLHHLHEFDGTGVGLAICKRIIERHNGRVWAEGEKGVGATFYFSLPL
jgi:signal transduction histidine kinase